MNSFLEKGYNKLKDLLVKELSLVNRGANQGAKVVLFKHENLTGGNINTNKNKSLQQEEIEMNLEEVLKSVGEALDSKLSPLVSKVEELEKKISTSEKEETNPVEKAEVKTEAVDAAKMLDVLKAEREAFNSQLEAIKKEVEQAKKVADEHKAARERAELEKRIEKEFPYLQGTMDQKVELLQKLEGDEFALSLLKAANQTNQSLFKSYGHSVSVTKDSEKRLEDLVKAYQEANPKLSKEAAFTKVLETPEGEKLYTEMNG